MTKKEKQIIRECKEATAKHFLAVEKAIQNVSLPVLRRRRKITLGEVIDSLFDVKEGLTVTETKLYQLLHGDSK